MNTDWYIRPNTVFKFQDGCNEAVNGLCLQDLSLQECISACKDTRGECTAGYYIDSTKTTQSVCVPIKTDVNPMINPLNIIESQDTVPYLKQKVSVFWDTNVFPLSSDQMKNVHFRTVVGLQNVETGLFVKSNIESEGHVSMTDQSIDSTLVVIHPSHYSIYTDIFKPVMYNTHLMFASLNTSLRMLQSDSRNIDWSISGETPRKDSYVIVPIKDSTYKNIQYGIPFYIQTSLGHTVIVEQNSLSLSSLSLDQIRDAHIPIEFVFVSKENGYYCKEGECHTVSGKDIFSTNGLVTRNPECGRICKSHLNSSDENNNTQSKNHTYLYILIFVCILVIMYIIYKAYL